jgi:hypothetical protein
MAWDVQAYREKFRKEVLPGYYSGKVHLWFLIIITPILFLTPLFFVKFSWTGVILFVASIWYCNFLVYLLHRYILHRKVKGLKWTADMHMHHHLLYTEDKMQYEHIDDIYMLLMPPSIWAYYHFIHVPVNFLIASYFVSTNELLYIISAFYLWQGYYELSHYIEHLPDDHWTMKIPYCKWIQEHHKIHHRLNLMNSKHFDIGIPINDPLLGTKYKEY